MTKEYLAAHIIDAVTISNEKGESAFESVINLLDVLTPKDRIEFSRWGSTNEQSTAIKCWE